MEVHELQGDSNVNGSVTIQETEEGETAEVSVTRGRTVGLEKMGLERSRDEARGL